MIRSGLPRSARSSRISTLAAITTLALAGNAHAGEAPSTPAEPAALVAPVLNVMNPAKTVEFYRAVFGMELAMTLDAGTKREYMLRSGTNPAAASLVLMHDPAAPVDTRLEHGTAFSRLVLRVASLEDAALRLDSARAPHGPIRAVAKGYRMMMATDPEGYRLELVQRDPAR